MTLTKKLAVSQFITTSKNDYYHLFLNGSFFLYYIIIALLFCFFIIFKRYRSPKTIIISLCCIVKVFFSSLFLTDFLNFIDNQKYNYSKNSFYFSKLLKSLSTISSITTSSTLNSFHFYLFISFITFALYFIISYKLYGIVYKKSENEINNGGIINEIRNKLLNTIFKGRRVAIVELIALVWIFSLLFMILQSSLFETSNIESGKSKKVLIFSLLSLISFGYLLLNIRTRSKNLQISRNSFLDNHSTTTTAIKNKVTFELFNLEISKDIVITKLNDSFAQFIYYSTMYYFSITLVYYSITISSGFWKLALDGVSPTFSLAISTYQAIANVLPIIDIIFTITFIIHSITLINYSNQIYEIDKVIINKNKSK
ncbi:hypothetical protein DDB_G0273279 [Dictyostelium discoideum AX4]|uniref:Uncharacterized protein n=1 Tax=Dictyostelium discoideum TaxID=44689 RepID=Q556T9_DICDI|nr:hypothetical protein DDB_G0273827 [Dictyostelium discoideum AX4]XP_644720.1 hypothetical protein DDB_G0273279 [Dictyostelium discoideum AX4]EAL70604.1 hypothetical protein DDB_G0273827 [Dictyostelium discoideum AX4]EAL70857.1 hypothetical protein DDB_G0273279 [Dictyostelium discoideum AX4]|eukprot:XP_644530.1 hypothetical protein DDB_G0273827 [Dictyostelium discoideum AX4]